MIVQKEVFVMAIRLPAIRRAALPTTRMLWETLGRSGVIRADGCMISSAGMGMPPAGFDRVSISLKAGCQPLEDSRIRSIRAAVAAEVAMAVLDFCPTECSGDGVCADSFAEPQAVLEYPCPVRHSVGAVAG